MNRPNFSRLNKGIPARYRRLDFPIENAISINEYCQKHHLTRSGVRYRILCGHVYAYKSGGRWWVYEQSGVDSR